MDDTETLRLRAKAKAKAARDRGVDNGATISAPPTPAQRINQAASAYQQPLGQAVEQFKSGNYPAALLNLGNTAMQAVGTPFSLASEGWRNVPVIGGLVSGAINAVPNVTNSLYGLLQSGANKGLNAVGYTPEFERGLLGITPKTQEETSSALQNFGGGAAQFLAAPLIGKGMVKTGEAIPKLGQALENVGTGASQRAFKAGETQPEIKAFGQFSQEYGARLNKPGFADLTDFTRRLNSELNQKIIDPATKAGVLIKGDNVLNAMRRLYEEEFSKMSPSTTRLAAIDKMMKETQARLQQTEVPGMLTPREAQDMMVNNNKELGKLYEKEKSMQGLTGDENTRKLQLKLGNDQLRAELEQIHPEVKNIKWTEKAGMAVSRMMDDYIKSKMKGEEAPHATLRAGLKGMAGVTVYDLLRLRPFMARLGTALGKTGRALSLNEPSFATGVNNPYQASPPQTGIVPFGGIPPSGGGGFGGVGGGIGGTPRSGVPFTPTPQDATYTDIRGNRLPPRQQAQLSAPEPKTPISALPYEFVQKLKDAGYTEEALSNMSDAEINKAYKDVRAKNANVVGMADPDYGKIKPIIDQAGMRFENFDTVNGEKFVRFTDDKGGVHTRALPIDGLTPERVRAEIDAANRGETTFDVKNNVYKYEPRKVPLVGGYAKSSKQIDAIGNEKVQFNPENVQQPTSSIKNVDLHRDLTNIVNLAARKAFGKSLEEARTEHYKEAETFGNYRSAKARTTSDWNRKVERELGGVLTSPEFINELQKQGFNVDNEGKFRIATPTKSYSIPIEKALEFLNKMKSKSIQNLFRSKDLGGTLSYLTNNLPRNIA